MTNPQLELFPVFFFCQSSIGRLHLQLAIVFNVVSAMSSV